MANDLWARLLCDRDDVDGGFPVRYRAIWRRGVSAVSPPVRPYGDRWEGVGEDGAGNPEIVRSNAGTKVGNIDGCMCDLGWGIQQLRHRAGCESGDSHRRLRAGMPAKTGTVNVCDHAFAGENPARTGQHETYA